MISTIKIGARRYSLRAMPAEDRSEIHGKISMDRGLIMLDPAIPADNQAETLLHEILHGVWYAYNLEDGLKEEAVVTALGTGLMAIFVDNPDLMKVLMDAALRGRPVLKEAK